MPRFTYRAKDHARHARAGTIEAENETAAITRLGREGVFPISISEVGAPSSASLPALSSRVSPRVLAYTTHQLADLLGGGLPLLSALTLLAKQTEHHALRRVIEALTNAVRDGRALSDALADHPKVFPPMYRSLVRAGEVGGSLEQSLRRLAEIGEHEAELKSRVMNASAYPIFVLCLAVAMTVFLMAYVIPKLSLVFLETGQLLPLPTRFLLAVSALFTRWWWAFLIGVVLAVVGGRRWYASQAGRSIIDRAFITVPALGMLVRRIETARFTRNLGTMLSQGVPILHAMEVVTTNIANSTLRAAVSRTLEAVREGASLAEALAATQEFPVFVSNMVAVGEESGTVDAALLKVSATYEREIDRTIATLTTILEPVLLVIVGGVVLCIVLAMLLPIFQIGLEV